MSSQRNVPTDYAQRYQQLNSRVVYSNYVSNYQRVQLGRGVFLPTAQPYRDASFVPVLKVGEIFTTPTEQQIYISRETIPYQSSALPPSAPLNVSVTPGSGSVDVTWDLPASNGGSAILYYTIVSSPDGVTVTTSSTSVTVSGLINGIEYTFDVTATNSAGTSDATTSPAATPVGSGFATQTFTTVGDIAWLAPSVGTIVQYLIVGGGGGGGNGYDTGAGGGGGAGVVLTGTTTVTADTNYTVTVGDGGLGGASPYPPGQNLAGTNGNLSAFHTIVALGGSGGYGSRTQTGGSSTGGSQGTSVVGGGPGRGGGSNGSGGGGGGAGSAGSNGVSGTGGAGGTGVSSSLSGTPVTYGAGGAGARGNTAVIGAAGTANSGNGGGGGSYSSGGSRAGGNGGSGIVIIRYYNP